MHRDSRELETRNNVRFGSGKVDGAAFNAKRKEKADVVRGAAAAAMKTVTAARHAGFVPALVMPRATVASVDASRSPFVAQVKARPLGNLSLSERVAGLIHVLSWIVLLPGWANVWR